MGMDKIIELLPYWFYLAGSVCFAIGSVIVLYRELAG